MATEFDELIADVTRARRRAADAKYLEAKREFADETYPLLEAILAAVDERLSETEDMVAELLEGSASVVQPDLAMQLHGVFDLGRQLCVGVLAMANPSPGAVGIAVPQPLLVLCEAFLQAAGLAEAAVSDATVEKAHDLDDALDANEDEDEDEEDLDDDVDDEDENDMAEDTDAIDDKEEVQ